MRRNLMLLFMAYMLVGPADSGTLLLPSKALQPEELILVVNDADPLSKRVAAYYQKKRKIPPENVIHVRFRPGKVELDLKVFRHVYGIVDKKIPARAKALALAWTRPYRVGCMSVTMAFATGYDESYCPSKLADKPCGVSKKHPYFANFNPASGLKSLRPTMLLAAEDFGQAQRLIDRGVASDGTLPQGAAYLLSTSDTSRSVRATGFSKVEQMLGGLLSIKILQQDDLRDKDDVLFYFTGKARVAGLETLVFLPGAVADHLTSFGGQMKPSSTTGQMSSLRWLEAGATGSYGTVFEPCNFPEKFPAPGLLMLFYLRGETLLEAYWKSVAWPAEGLFIGEPLARPFARERIEFSGSEFHLPAHRLWPGKYALEAADYPIGPYRAVGRIVSPDSPTGRYVLSGLNNAYFRLVPIGGNSR